MKAPTMDPFEKDMRDLLRLAKSQGRSAPMVEWALGEIDRLRAIEARVVEYLLDTSLTHPDVVETTLNNALRDILVDDEGVTTTEEYDQLVDAAVVRVTVTKGLTRLTAALAEGEENR